MHHPNHPKKHVRVFNILTMRAKLGLTIPVALLVDRISSNGMRTSAKSNIFQPMSVPPKNQSGIP